MLSFHPAINYRGTEWIASRVYDGIFENFSAFVAASMRYVYRRWQVEVAVFIHARTTQRTNAYEDKRCVRVRVDAWNSAPMREQTKVRKRTNADRMADELMAKRKRRHRAMVIRVPSFAVYRISFYRIIGRLRISTYLFIGNYRKSIESAYNESTTIYKISKVRCLLQRFQSKRNEFSV